VLSLWLAIGLGANAILWLGAIAWVLAQRKLFIRSLQSDLDQLNIQFSLADIGILLISALLIFQSSVGPFNYDTGLYHLQATKWIEQYGVVPGLGNLHTRLAFGSIWFPLAALFSFSEILPQPLHSVNGFLLLLCLLFAFSSIKALIAGNITPAKVVQLLAAIPLIHLIYDPLRFSVEVSSLSTDMPVAAIILVILIVAVQLRDGEVEASAMPIYLATVASLTLIVIAIKVSAFPIALVTGYLFIVYRHYLSFRLLLILGSLGLVVFIPFLIRNVISSGYLIYPFYQLDLFSVDWKIPVEIARDDRLSIGTWVKAPGKSAAELAAGGWRSWLPGWWGRVSRDLVLRVWPVAIAVALVAGLVGKSAVRAIIHRWQWLYGLLALSIVLWFFNSPDIRLGYGFLTGLPLLLIAPGITQLLKTTSTQGTTAILTSYAYGCLLLSIFKFNFYSTDIEFLTLPMDYPPAQVQSAMVHDIEVYWPLDKDQCWNADLPCLHRFSDRWQLRGTTLKAGFRNE
ncbi:MAG: hypothetical protein AAFV72_17875, partial [Cyanobacteria bacterium J06635_1]